MGATPPRLGAFLLPLGFLLLAVTGLTHESGVVFEVRADGHAVIWPPAVATKLTWCLDIRSVEALDGIDRVSVVHRNARERESQLDYVIDKIRNTFQSAAAEWEAAALVKFVYVDDHRCDVDSNVWMRLRFETKLEYLATALIQPLMRDYVSGRYGPPLFDLDGEVLTWSIATQPPTRLSVVARQDAVIILNADTLRDPFLFRDTLLHELGHALGLYHEHSKKHDSLQPECREELPNVQLKQFPKPDPSSVMSYAWCGGSRERHLSLSFFDRSSLLSLYNIPMSVERSSHVEKQTTFLHKQVSSNITISTTTSSFITAEVVIRLPRIIRADHLYLSDADTDAFHQDQRTNCYFEQYKNEFCREFGFHSKPVGHEDFELECSRSGRRKVDSDGRRISRLLDLIGDHSLVFLTQLVGRWCDCEPKCDCLVVRVISDALLPLLPRIKFPWLIPKRFQMPFMLEIEDSDGNKSKNDIRAVTCGGFGGDVSNTVPIAVASGGVPEVYRPDSNSRSFSVPIIWEQAGSSAKSAAEREWMRKRIPDVAPFRYSMTLSSPVQFQDSVVVEVVVSKVSPVKNLGDTIELSGRDMDDEALLHTLEKLTGRMPAKEVERLIVKGNRLRSIPFGIVCLLPSLSFIDASHNSIETVDALAMWELKYLNLAKNLLTDAALNPRTWTMPTNLTCSVRAGKSQRLLKTHVAHYIHEMMAKEHPASEGQRRKELHGHHSTHATGHTELSTASIAASTFSPLIELDVSHNLLTRLPIAILSLAPKLSQLELSHNNITKIVAWTESGIASAPHLSTIGLPKSLKTVALANTLVEELPQGLVDLTLVRLDMRNCRIKQLPVNVVAQLRHLEELLVSGNPSKRSGESLEFTTATSQDGQLRTMPTGGARSKPTGVDDGQEVGSLCVYNDKPSSRLQRIDLSNCGLTAVPDALFVGCNLLQHLDITSNRLQSLPASVFTKALTTFRIDENSLTELPSELCNSQGLRTIAARRNRLEVLPDCIAKLTRLQSLLVDNNNLAKLPSFGESDKLPAFLSFLRRRDMVTSLDGSDANDASSELSMITASRNLLTSIPNMASLQRLDLLDLSHNRLTELNGETQGLLSLSRLDLSHNNISSLPTRMATLINLQTVSLSHNRFEKVPIVIAFWKRLYSLDISWNNVTAITRRGPLSKTKLTTIDLSHNQLVNVTMLGFPRQYLRRLDLSWNDIVEVRPRAGAVRFEQIQSLDLSHNKMEVLNFIPMSDMLTLGELKFNDNHATTVFGRNSRNLKFKTLDIRNNNLTLDRLGQKFLKNSLNLRLLPPNQCAGLQELFAVNSGIPGDTQNYFGWDAARVLDGFDNSTKTFRNPRKGLTEIPSYLWGHQNLEEIYLNHNSIRWLPEERPPNTPNLIGLFLEGNLIETIPSWVFDYGQMKVLTLGANPFKELPADIPPSGMLILSLNSASLSSIPPSIANLTKLQELHLTNHFVKSLPEEMCTMKDLSLIQMSDGMLESIPACFGHDVLKSLMVSGNKLESVPDFRAIDQLDVSVNRIRSIEVSSPYLESFNIARNRVRTISLNSTSLQYLSLSYNKLRSLPPLIKQTKLKEVIATNNKLREVPTMPPSVRYVNVEKNRWLKSVDGVFTPQLQQLVISHTSVSSIPDTAVVSKDTLKRLEARGAKLTYVTPLLANYTGESPITWELSDNRLSSITLPPIMRYLDLAGNVLNSSGIRFTELWDGFCAVQTLILDRNPIRQLSLPHHCFNSYFRCWHCSLDRVDSLLSCTQTTDLAFNNLTRMHLDKLTWCTWKRSKVGSSPYDDRLDLRYSHNDIVSIDEDVMAIRQSNATVMDMDLSHNPLKSVPSNMQELSKLSTQPCPGCERLPMRLNIAHTDVTALPAVDITVVRFWLGSMWFSNLPPVMAEQSIRSTTMQSCYVINRFARGYEFIAGDDDYKRVCKATEVKAMEMITSSLSSALLGSFSATLQMEVHDPFHMQSAERPSLSRLRLPSLQLLLVRNVTNRSPRGDASARKLIVAETITVPDFDATLKIDFDQATNVTSACISRLSQSVSTCHDLPPQMGMSNDHPTYLFRGIDIDKCEFMPPPIPFYILPTIRDFKCPVKMPFQEGIGQSIVLSTDIPQTQEQRARIVRIKLLNFVIYFDDVTVW